MEVLLAGYNVDTDVIDELKKDAPGRQDVTPETLSAAYARISRDPRPINELRKASREEVEKSRKSNSSIIFKMGHHSVAEHAVFNFDLIGVSRLAVESIEHHRLCSFTEKSQRYITLESDFVIPHEIGNSSYKDPYIRLIGEMSALYVKLNEKLQEHVFKKHAELAKDPKNKTLLEGWAKEDARYITPLATAAQLGLTVNARNLELVFRRAASQKLSEVKEISKKMYSLVEKIAPSIILFTEANDYDSLTYDAVKSQLPRTNSQVSSKPQPPNPRPREVELVDYTKDADNMLVASLLYSVTLKSLSECVEQAKKMTAGEKEGLVKETGRHMQLYDTTLREFENVDLTFDVVLSSSCFAQLKRHRMATIIAQPYDPALGLMVPPAIEEIGMSSEFKEIAKKAEDLFAKMETVMPLAAPYILTNAHRRRVIFKCNARELYHVSRLREDAHAQWDIQNISRLMSEAAKKAMPLTMMFIGGKDVYTEMHGNIFGKS